MISNEEREAKLTPYKNTIDELILQILESTYSGSVAATVYAAKRYTIKAFVGDYILQHDTLPTGTHDLGYVMGLNIGEIDFDKMIAKIHDDKEETKVIDIVDARIIGLCEEEGEELVECPYCGQGDGCDHLVAGIDLTFGEIEDGVLYEEAQMLRKPIEDAFVAAHVNNAANPPFSSSKDLMQLWKDCEICPDDQCEPVSFFNVGLYQFFADRLKKAGAVGLEREINGGPGFSSKICDLFAEDPQQVIETYFKELAADLKNDS